MRIAFYAPLKPPDHPVPSGDRRIARLMAEALTLAGHEVELAARLRSWEGTGDPALQARIKAVGSRLASRLEERLSRRARAERPDLWLTYHLYHKAPDWLGPRVSAALGIPYVVAEASAAAKQSDGPWAQGHAAVVDALGQAAAVFGLNPADAAGVRPHLVDPARLYALSPFLDIEPYVEARRAQPCYRQSLADELDLPEDRPWLIAVGMMRPGDKLASYRELASALERLDDMSWHLVIVGDGPARAEVEHAFAGLAPRVRFAGHRSDIALTVIYAAGDLLVWPAVNEAFGMSVLEALAAGLPTVAGDWGGVRQIVAHGSTGLVVPPGDPAAFAAAVRLLLGDPDRRAAMSTAAAAKAEREHDLPGAAARLDTVLRGIGAS